MNIKRDRGIFNYPIKTHYYVEATNGDSGPVFASGWITILEDGYSTNARLYIKVRRILGGLHKDNRFFHVSHESECKYKYDPNNKFHVI